MASQMTNLGVNAITELCSHMVAEADNIEDIVVVGK